MLISSMLPWFVFLLAALSPVAARHDTPSDDSDGVSMESVINFLVLFAILVAIFAACAPCSCMDRPAPVRDKVIKVQIVNDDVPSGHGNRG